MSIVIDLIMIALLIGVIMHSIHLSQSLKNFHALHHEIKPLLKEHASSISNSAKHVDQLRGLIRDVNQAVQTKTPEVHMLKQDLEFMTNRANQVADYLEKLLQDARVMGIANQYLNRKAAPEEEVVTLKVAKAAAGGTKVKIEKEAAPAITHATIIKRLRQKISMPKAPLLSQKIKQKTTEPFFKPTFTQKLVDKLREKNHAA